MRAWALIGALVTPVVFMAACAPKQAPKVVYRDPDCGKAFAEEAPGLAAQPGLVAAGTVGAEPYSYYSAADGSVSYLITRKGSPAHPAILIQRAHKGITTDGCAWGSKPAYDELKAYLESLKAWTRKGAKT